jgi:acetylornithine deacetylase/succinyl-diaminopimelate desuccinylase-like protein
VAFGTDIPFLRDVGKPVLFGPGSILDAHTAGEKIAKESMLQAASAYADLARRLSARE